MACRRRSAVRLQLASVIGLKFWDAALAHVDPQAAEQLPSLRRRELIVLEDAQDSVGEYAFRHQILHQVTYDTLLKRDKRSAHARTAQWLAQHAGARAQGLLATAAEHYAKAGDAANAAEFYARAAAHHAATFANEQALDVHGARAGVGVAGRQRDLRWRLLATRERTLELARPARCPAAGHRGACWRWPRPCRQAPRATRGGPRRPGGAATSPTAWANGRARNARRDRALQAGGACRR